MNISQIVYHKCGLFFWTPNGFSRSWNYFINTHSFSTKLGSHSPVNVTSNSPFSTTYKKSRNHWPISYDVLDIFECKWRQEYLHLPAVQDGFREVKLHFTTQTCLEEICLNEKFYTKITMNTLVSRLCLSCRVQRKTKHSRNR